MLNEFSIARIPATASISLKTQWVVKADPSYDVHRGGTAQREIVLIRTVKGKGALIIEGMQPFSIDEDTVLLVELSRIKRYYCTDTCWNFWWFEFFISDIPNLPLYQVLRSSYLFDEEEQVLTCMRTLREDDQIAQHLASSLFAVLIYRWLRNSVDSFCSPQLYEKEIREVASYMQAHLGDKMDMNQLAKKVGVCDKRFRQLFKAVYHIPPKKYYDQLRMQASEAMLRNTNIPICEIADKLGFSSSFHFTREFKKVYNESPSTFRKGAP